MNLVLGILTAILAFSGIAISIWSIMDTRKKYYDEFFKEYNISNSFDWKLWIRQISKGGQGVLNEPLISLNQKITIAWNSYLTHTGNYNYCIKECLEDNTIRYVLRRGQVERFKKVDAEKKVIEVNKRVFEQKQKKDYFCITNKEKIFGKYNYLKNMIDFYDKLIKIEKYEVDKVTKRIINEYKIMDNYYAPLIYITLGENQDIFEMDNIVVLLSDPLEIQKYIENWKNVNIHLEKMELSIIEDDKHFDDFMNIVFKEYDGAIINPQFNIDGELIKFIEIKKFEDVVND